MSENNSKYQKREYRVYKPNNNGSGSASSWQISTKIVDSKEEKNVFLDLANQKPSNNDNAAFDWDSKLTAKLGLNDLGDMLAVLRGLKDGVGNLKDGKRSGLYHQNSKGNTVIYFNENVKDNLLQGYSLRVSKKSDQNQSAVNHSLTVSEGQVLLLFLQEAVSALFS